MRLRSINCKLLGLVSGAFVLLAIMVVMLSDHQLTKMTDASQEQIYSEKLNDILRTLSSSHQRLQDTLMVEAYEEDFKESVLSALRLAHYKEPYPAVYPLLLDEQGTLVMHPRLPTGSKALAQGPYFQQAQEMSEGSFDYISSDGQARWGICKDFAPWGWKVGYTVPIAIKYANAHKFRQTLIVTMATVTASVVLILFILLTRTITRPIVRLTNMSTAVAQGDWAQEITIHTNDEVGVLARSFGDMQDVIREKMAALAENNTELIQHRHHLEERVEARTLELERTNTLLKESKDRLDQLAGHSRTISWEVDTNGLFTYVSPVIYEVLGYRPEEVEGRMHFYDLNPEEGREAFKAAILEVFKQKGHL